MFRLADYEYDDCHDGIFQARICDSDSHLAGMHHKDLPKNVPSGACLENGSLEKFAIPHIHLLDVSRTSTPFCTSITGKCKNDGLKDTARCSSGKRRASSFVSNINPLQISNVHDSMRSSALFSSEPLSKYLVIVLQAVIAMFSHSLFSVWKKNPAFLSSSTRSAQQILQNRVEASKKVKSVRRLPSAHSDHSRSAKGATLTSSTTDSGY
jgi:hypothetical protein